MRYLKKNIFLIITISIIVYVFFVHSGITSISEKNASIDISSDAEINYLTALSVYRGEGWYKDFSNVYPPGRFILQAGLFHLISPSVPTATLYFNSFVFFFSVTFFFLSHKIFSHLSKNKYLPYLIASTTTFLYLCFIKSAQEVHAVLAFFFIILLTRFKDIRLKQIILGVVLGVVFLFRIDAGIILMIASIIGGVVKRDNIKTWFVGLTLVWLPMILLIIVEGSLYNFLYDTVYYALIVQPKIIDLPIPPKPISLLFQSMLVFLLSSTVSLSIYANNLIGDKKYAVKTFTIISLLTFSAALGRSDEGHLWYGSVWVTIYIGYLLFYLSQPGRFLKELKIITVPLILIFLGLSFLLINIKNPLFFILLSSFIFLLTASVKRQYASSVLAAGLISALLIFHSFSFLRLRFSPPQRSFISLPKYSTFVSEESEVAGLQFSKETMSVLKEIKSMMSEDNKWLFIYPDHALLYEYFKLKNPTRHDYQLEQTTEVVQREIIEDLKRTGTASFIIFPDSIRDDRPVWQWIKKNTIVVKTYLLEENRVELRIKK